jgi:predicted RNA polymerase sigma factor
MSFEEWYRGTYPQLVAALVLVAGDEELARDAADEAMVRAFERWSRVRSMGSPGGWATARKDR